jgi:hypothetical protein
MTTDLTCITGRRLNRASSKWILMDIHETIYLLLRVPLSRYLLTSRFRHFGLHSDKTRTVEARYFFIPLVCSLSQRIFLRNLFPCFQQETHVIAPRLPMQCTGVCQWCATLHFNRRQTRGLTGDLIFQPVSPSTTTSAAAFLKLFNEFCISQNSVLVRR